jgi:hypothetical protein
VRLFEAGFMQSLLNLIDEGVVTEASAIFIL